MMVFYSKITGEIVGTVHGRIHAEGEKKMWVGDKEETERIIYEWVEKKEGNGFVLPEDITDDEKRLLIDVEADSLSTNKYIVDLKTGKPKRKSETTIKLEKELRDNPKRVNKPRSPRDILMELEKRIEKLEANSLI